MQLLYSFLNFNRLIDSNSYSSDRQIKINILNKSIIDSKYFWPISLLTCFPLIGNISSRANCFWFHEANKWRLFLIRSLHLSGRQKNMHIYSFQFSFCRSHKFITNQIFTSLSFIFITCQLFWTFTTIILIWLSSLYITYEFAHIQIHIEKCGWMESHHQINSNFR